MLDLRKLSIYPDFELIVKFYRTHVDFSNVTTGLSKAIDEQIKLSFESACEADLRNINIYKTVENAINNVDKEK